MKIKLDLKDKKILWELDKNARTPSSQIAKKVGLTSEAVNYRIKRFEKENIITQYQVIINLGKLKIIQFKLCLSFQYLESKKLNQILEKLKKKDYVKWIVLCRGNWDLILSLETTSLEKIDELKNKVLELFENFIREKSLSILVEAETYQRNYLLEEKKENKSRIIMKSDSFIELDELDLAIFKQLSKNARSSIVNIAEELSSTPRVINYKIKQLEKKKVILGYKIAINYEKLGIKFYKLFIYLGNIKKDKVNPLINYFVNHQNIIHNVIVVGNWDFEPEIETFSDEEFERILKEIKDNFSDIIRKIEVITISKEHKFVYF